MQWVDSIRFDYGLKGAGLLSFKQRVGLNVCCPMALASWSLVLGVLLITMVLVGTLLARLPLSTAMLSLGIGYLLGPGGAGVITPDPIRHAGMLEVAAEIGRASCR